MVDRLYSWNAYETTLTSGVDTLATTFNVVSSENITAPTILVIDPDDPLLREFVRVTAVGVNQFTVERNEEGSTGAVGHAHDPDAIIRAVSVHQWLTSIYEGIILNENDIVDLNDWDQDHVDGTVADPHTQYLKESDASTLYLALTGGTMSGDIDMNQDNTLFFVKQVIGGVNSPFILQPGNNRPLRIQNDAGETRFEVFPISSPGWAFYDDVDGIVWAWTESLGALSAGVHKIVDVVDPTDAQGAATKAYVDSQDHDHATPIAAHNVDPGAHAAEFALYLPLTGGIITGSLVVQGETTAEAALNLGVTSGQFLRMVEFSPGVFQMYVSNGANNGTRYGLQFYASDTDFLDVSFDGHVFTTGEVLDSEAMFRNMSNENVEPTAPVKGQYWIDTAGKAIKVWTGAAWVAILNGI